MPWYEMTVRVEAEPDEIEELADRVVEVVCAGEPGDDHVCGRQWVVSVGPVTDAEPEDGEPQEVP